jgi:hypothetical protein
MNLFGNSTIPPVKSSKVSALCRNVIVAITVSLSPQCVALL